MSRSGGLGVTLTAWILGLIVPVVGAQAADEQTRHYRLDEVLALAEERNPALAGAEGALTQSRGQQIAAAAYPNPSVSATVGHGAIRDPSTGVSITERTVTIWQPLEWSGKRRARQQAAMAGVAEATAALEETRLTLITEVKIAFYHMLFTQRDADLALQNLASVKEVLRTARARVAAGEATSFETMKATVEVQQATKEVARAQNAVIVARARLDSLTSGALGDDFSVQGDFATLREGIDLGGRAAGALEQHPVARRLASLAEQAAHHVALERESRIPNIVVQGQYHREAGDESFVAGLRIPIPLWDQRQGEIKSALGAKHRAEAERIRVRNELQQAITQSLQEVRTASAQIQVFETGLLKQAEQTLRIARTSFRHGAASLLDLIDAQRVYRQTVLEYTRARADLAVALAKFERAIGAPYEAEASAPTRLRGE